MKKLHKMKSLAGLGKAKLKNALRCTLLILGLLVGANSAWAQTRANEIRMKTGNETITDEVTYNFYDSGGPYIMTPEEDPNNDYNWVTWYQHNESYLLHLVKPAGYDTKGIQITFNYLLINDDHLKIYEGDLENEENLIVDLTCNDFSTAYPQGYTVVSHGNMTVRFESNNQYRDAGWDADVRLWDYTPKAPVALMEACESNIVLLPGSKGTNSTAMYYTTNGSTPAIDATTGNVLNGTPYTGPFAITETTTVKAILVENGTSSSTVSSNTFNSLITPPVQPTITRVEGTNNFEIDAHWSNDLRDTYYIHYTTDGTDPQFAPASQQLVCSERGADGTYVNKINTVAMDHTGTLRVVTRGTTCPDLFSDEASETVTEVFVPTPEITVSGTGNTGTATITCSLATATIYYTLDGTDPTTATTTSGTSPLSVSVPAGSTIKAMAAHSGTGYTNSGIATAIYIPGGDGNSGVFGTTVLLDDREDHSWSYYSDTTNPIRSLKPADVKITYKGFGENTMTSTSTANMPANADFTEDVESSQVGVNVGETENQFIYLKTLENANADGSGNYPYTMIPNPFQVRPVYSEGETPSEPTIDVTIGSGNNTSQYLPTYTYNRYSFSEQIYTAAEIGSAGTIRTLSFRVSSNATSRNVAIYLKHTTKTSFTSNTNWESMSNSDLVFNGTVTFTSGWTEITLDTPFEYNGTSNLIVAVDDNNYDYTFNAMQCYTYNAGSDRSIYVTSDNTNYTPSTTTYTGTRGSYCDQIKFSSNGGSSSSANYRGFYAWRVKSLSSGLSITDGTNTYGVNSIIYPDQEIEFVTANAKGNEVEFEALWAQAYVNSSTYATNSGNYQNAYERNFKVGTSITTYDYPVTFSTIYPDGTGTAGSISVGSDYTCSNDVKFENITFTNGGSRTFTANNHDLIFGRGVSGTVNTVRGHYSNNSVSTNLDFTIRVESGTYNNFYLINVYGGNNTTTYSGTISIRGIIGCDYDRASNNNELLSVAPSGSIKAGERLTMTNSANKDRLTFDWNVKSGKIQENLLGTATAEQSLYMTGGTTYQYNGKRRLIAEGGEFASIAGGIDGTGGYNQTNYSTYNTLDAKDKLYIRMKGNAHVRGVIYGAAQFAGSAGGRTMVFTGGTINGWIAGGCNGTNTDGGELYGETYIYFGGKAQCDSNGSSTTIGPGQATGGNIFGAGSGNSGATGDNATVGRVNSSTIVVADSAIIERNVYGGGNYGYVRDGETNKSDLYVLGGTVKGSVFGGSNMQKGQNVNIWMKDGTVEGSLYGGSNTQGTINYLATINMSGGTVTNVFGGGYGSNTVMAQNTVVNVSGGTINNNVYGGGALGTVTGNTTVSVSGGTMNNIFGAGQGRAAATGVTAVTANIGGTTTVNVSGGSIAESVYGGGEIGNVKQATNPSAKGEEGIMADPTPVSTVNITGGNIASNVFGGGRMGFTNGGTLVNMSGGSVEGSVFGGAFGTQGNVYVAGLRVVNMRGGTVNKHVYGGSRNADDALSFNPGTFPTNEARTASVVNFAGGYVHYQVFASGYFGNVFGSTYAFIGTNAILNAPNHVYDNTEANQNFFNAHQALRIGGSVWAGGDFGNYDGTKFGDPTVSGRSNVYIDGTGYDTESNNTTNTNYMYIGGSVYGSGTSCDAGKQGRHIVIQNYGKVIEASQPTAALPYSSATRALYSVQRADSLDIVDSHIVFLGEGKINSLVTTEKYTIHEFNKVRINNGSSIFLNYPADQMKKFGSYKVDNVYNPTPVYTKVTHETSRLEETPNKIRVSNGAFIQIKYVDDQNTAQYGELEGFAYMMSDDANNTCAYARPKQSTESGNIIPAAYDNPNDGGWVSYDATLNDYTIGGASVPAGGSDQMRYENHTVNLRNGEQYFRIWRAGGTLSYREGVFVAQSDGTTDYSTTDVVISLPAFKNESCEEGTAFYRIKSFDGNTTIDYGTDLMTVNAACYGDPDEAQWMYINGDNAQASFVTEQTQAQCSNLHYISEMPNVNFGLVAIPQGGLRGDDNMIICEASDPKIATMQWANAHNDEMPQVTFRLTYNNNLTNNVVWDPIHITFEQVSCDGETVLATVDVALTVTTLTNIEQDFVTQAYAVTRGNGSATGSYTAKIVLPQYVMHVNSVGEISKWTCKQVTFEPEDGYSSDLFVHGTNYLNAGDLTQCNNKFGMNLVAGLNFDNTTGWEAYPLTPQDMQGWSNTTYVFGETTARDPIGFDFTLLYDGRQKANGNYKVGTLTFVMHFTNYEGASQGTPQYEKDLNIKIEVWFLGQGANYYIDGVHGNNLYSGKFPNAAKQTLSGIFNRTDYKAGDNIFVVNTVTADGNKTMTWNGKAYDEVTLYRYPGGHRCVPNETGAESHYMDYDIENNAAFTGTLVEVEGSMEMTGIVLDGFYFESQKPEGEAAGDIEEGSNQYFHTYVPAVAPLVNIANGGRLSVYGQSRLENNYNSSTDGGGVYIANGGVLNLYDGSAVDTNFVATTKNGGGIYVNSTSKVQLSDVVNITGNQQISSSKAGEGVDNNVYLSTYDSHVDIGTVETDDPFNQLLVTSKVGITKNPDWGTYYYAPVAFSDGGQTYLSNLVTDNAPESGAIMWDDQTKYEILSLNNTHLTDPLNYVYFVGTWVTEVTSEPTGFSATEINTPQELAWAISVASGYNGQTAAPNTTFTLTDDIDMSANIWVPIGSNGNAYTGTFNGNGHVVTGLRSPLNSENMGMFGSTTDATITDLVAQANFAGGTMRNVGTVIGSMSGGTLNNVEAAGTLTGTNTTANMGGLVGIASGNAVIHSGFAVNTMTGGNNTVIGGLVGTLGGEEDNANLFNSYSNVVFAEGNPATTVGGLVGVNNGQIENCYNATETSYPFAYTNNGSIKFSYAAEGTENYVNASGTGATLTGHGTYGDVLGRKEIGYMYDDNKVTATNDYVASAITYDNGHNITKWPGLVSTLNQWVAGHSGYTPWFRPTSGDINSDLPVLGFPKDNSMGTVDGKFLRYGSNVNLNGIDALLTAYNDNGEGDSEPTANIFLYGNATEVANVPAANTHVFINEDAVLLQSGNGEFINTTVGVTFDNSSKKAYDYYGNKLEYDWHFMSTPLANAAIGATYGTPNGNGNDVNLTNMTGGYFPNGLTPMHGDIKWDFYSYYEPEYHWINLKRTDHFHIDGGASINYTNETNFVPGKGYMMAISQDSYMNSTGTLNNGDVEITLYKQESQAPAPEELYNEGWNLVGNPYQAYLDLNKVGAGNYYIYDAESNAYVPYAVQGSENPVTPSRYIHPHQGFFMHTDTDGATFTFGTNMATTATDAGSYFRGDDRINYPLVNLFATNERGNTDLAIVEFNRPEIGGATKVSFMTNANFSIAAHLNGEGYGLLFTPEGTEKVPVHFKAQEDGTYTLTWSTYNGDFSSLLLVDNKTGVITDMLRADKYTFDASADDYSSRFYLTYAVTGIDDNEYEPTVSTFAYFDGSEWVVNGQGQLDVVDMLGRTLLSERLTGDQSRVSLNGVSAGVYLMRVTNGKAVKVQKIVVR